MDVCIKAVAAIGGIIAALVGASAVTGAAGGTINSVRASSVQARDRRQKRARRVPEYDRVIRPCMLSLYTTPLEIFENAATEASSFRHWALVASFEDQSVRVIEGLEDDKGKLDAFILKDRPEEDKNEIYYDLGTVDISPEQLRELALKNRLNGKRYCPTTNSCQHWLKEYAKLISYATGKRVIAEKVNQFWTLTEVNPIFAYSWRYTNQSTSFNSNQSSFNQL